VRTFASIHVNGRHRQDLGDLAGLAESMRRHGLIQPVVIDPSGRLLAGQRRLEAAKLLGWKEIPSVTLDAADPIGVESDENAQRKPFTPSELVAIGRAIETLEAERAKERQRLAGPTGGKGRKASGSGKFPEAVRQDTRDAVAKSLGVSGRTYEKARAVVEAAEKDPERYAPLVQKMDRNGRVDPAFKVLALEQKRDEYRRRAAEAPAVGKVTNLEDVEGNYTTVYLDPPWDYRDSNVQGAAAHEYSTMTVEQIAALPVRRLLPEDGGHVWMWTTWPMHRDGAPHRLLEAWGLEWSGEIVWDKEKLLLGRWTRVQSEILILAVAGKVPRFAADVRGVHREESEEHSKKPEAFYDLIERFSPGPRIELFARRARDGWDRWGNEA